jgi:hypothetical protein
MKTQILNIISIILICIANVLIQKNSNVNFPISLVIAIVIGVLFRISFGIIINKHKK